MTRMSRLFQKPEKIKYEQEKVVRPKMFEQIGNEFSQQKSGTWEVSPLDLDDLQHLVDIQRLHPSHIDKIV